MAKAPAGGGGMEPAEMKKLLIKSKEEPVSVAVGMTKDGAIMTLHKIKQGRALVKDLEKDCPDLKNPRFGQAFVNVEEDAKLVILTLNKAAGGLGMKLKKTLKGTGFTKVRIQLEDGSVAEDIGEDDEEGKSPAAPAAAPAAAAPPPAAAAAPAAEATPAEAATDSDEPAAPAAPAAGPPPNAAVLDKSGQAWGAARKKVESELAKLHAEMTKHYDGHAFGADLDKVFKSKVEPMMTSLDTSLVSKLQEVSKNTDPASHQKLVGEAKQIISKYESFVNSEPLIAQLDKNPFVPLSIQKTLVATLQALTKTVH